MEISSLEMFILKLSMLQLQEFTHINVNFLITERGTLPQKKLDAKYWLQLLKHDGSTLYT